MKDAWEELRKKLEGGEARIYAETLRREEASAKALKEIRSAADEALRTPR